MSDESVTAHESTGESLSIAERAAELAPYRSATQTIGADDLAISRMMVAQPTSAAVQDGLVPSAGSIYVATDSADPEPAIVYQPGSGKAGALVHVLGMRKQWHGPDVNGDFRVWDLDAPDVPDDDEIKLAYVFALLAPEFDTQLPASMALKSTATQTAKRICTAIKRAEPAPPWSLAFRLTTTPRSNDRGRWHVPLATLVDADPEHVRLAGELATMLGITTTVIKATDAHTHAIDGKPVVDDNEPIGF